MVEDFQTSRRNTCPMDRDVCRARLRGRTSTWSTPLQCWWYLAAHLQIMLGKRHGWMNTNVRWTHSSSRDRCLACSDWSLHRGAWWTTTRGSSNLSSPWLPRSRCYSNTWRSSCDAIGVSQSIVINAFNSTPGWNICSWTAYIHKQLVMQTCYRIDCLTEFILAL